VSIEFPYITPQRRVQLAVEPDARTARVPFFFVGAGAPVN
jgi:hypothetical protein